MGLRYVSGKSNSKRKFIQVRTSKFSTRSFYINVGLGYETYLGKVEKRRKATPISGSFAMCKLDVLFDRSLLWGTIAALSN